MNCLLVGEHPSCFTPFTGKEEQGRNRKKETGCMRKGGKTNHEGENVIRGEKTKGEGRVRMERPKERNEFRLKRAEGERRRIYGSLTAIIQGP